jgi:anti-sigma regulatory factor (Ser/Thr protein kinase)
MTAEAQSSFVHAALIVDSDDAVIERLVPILRESIDAGLPVLMVVSEGLERLVRAELGPLGDRLEWSAPAAFYQRLGFAYEEFRRYLQQQHALGRRVHVVAEPDVPTTADPSSPVDRAAAYLSYEAVCNEAYATFGCPVTCVWDSRRHPTLTIESVRSLHNHEITASGRQPNEAHVPAMAYLARRNDIPLPRPSAAIGLDLTVSSLDELPSVRQVVRDWSGDESFTDDAIDDVLIAVTEIVTNGLIHGVPPVRLRAWSHTGTLVLQIDDLGGRALPATAGYFAPPPKQSSGRGLWLARQLADVVTIHSTVGLTSVRLHFPYDVTHRHPEN